MKRLLPLLVLFVAAGSAFAANPTITSISPSCTMAGGPQFTLTVNGTNYDNTSVVRWNGVGLATTFVSTTRLTAIVPAANIAIAGTAQVTVKNSTGSASNQVPFTISATPTISSLNPTCATAGGPVFTLTVNGTNYDPTSVVKWNGSGLATTFVSVTRITAIVPAANIATAGTAQVTVQNCNGPASSPMTFTIAATPVITSPLTACGTVGVAFSYTITTTNNPTSFTASPLPAGLSVNTSTGVISGTPTTAGTTNVTINASNGATPCNTATATLVITIRAVPTISSLSPICATAGGPQFTLTVNGSNFVSGSTANWNGSPLATAFVSATQLTAIVPAAFIATAGTASITVVTPCGGTSNAQTFTIVATPVITSPLTACGTKGVAFSYTITATNNPTSFTASPLPAGLSVNTSSGVISGTPTAAGTTNVTITARNGAGPCNTATATLVITISTAPTISSLNPNCTAAGGPQFTLTVNGNNFVSSSTVNWNGSPLATTFVSSTRLTATVPASLIATPGTASVTVGTCATNSGAATFTISAVPTISSLNPSCAAAGDSQFTLTVSGTNFVSTSTVNWNGAALTTTFVSSTQLTATVPANNIANPGTASITVVSPCGATSNAVTFPIEDTPSITSPLTATATVGSPFSYQITANNNPVSYYATDLPGGLTVDTTTGLISGTPTATGVFPVTISATNDPNDPCGGTATDTLTLTVSFPDGVFIPPFPGQVNVFNWGSTPPPPGATIPFPNASTNNNFILYWNPPGTNTHPAIADLATGGLQRNADQVGMSYNPYDPTNLNSRPDPSKNVWRGNPIPPNDNTSGQFGDPRASWYISDPWPTADYVTGSYWAGPNPNVVPLNWPDSGHPFSYTGLQPTGKGQYPPDIMASPTPAPDAPKSISLLSNPYRANAGNLSSIAELGNVWDPAQLSYTVVNPGGALPDIPNTATRSTRGAGGHTLAIGRPEFSMFDQNGMRAWQLLDVFSGKTASTNFTNTAGLVNLNTASRDVLRSLAAGILQNSDPAIQPISLLPPPNGNGLYPPTSAANVQADLFADAVINSRPLLSTAALSAIRDAQSQPFFGNPNQYSAQTPPTEWNDTGREELFSKIYNLATTRSRNFRVFVTGQSLDKNGKVLSTVTKVYHVFIKPNRDQTTGAIQSQQVQVKYEGSM